MASVFEILHVVKRPTVLELDPGVDPASVEAGMVAAVNSSGFMQVGADDEAAPVGIFQTQGYVPAYQSTGLQLAQPQGAVGSYQAGKKVSVIAGAGAVFKTDQFISLSGATIGTEVVGGAGGLLKARGVSTAPTIGLLIGKDAHGVATIQLRI